MKCRQDPVLGRFNGIDIKATKYASLSPYQFAGNNPITYNDPRGDDYNAQGEYEFYRHPNHFYPIAGFESIYGGSTGGSGGNGFLRGPGGAPGSGNHWSDQFSNLFRDYMLSSRSRFESIYGAEGSEERFNAARSYGSNMGGGPIGLSKAFADLGINAEIHSTKKGTKVKYISGNEFWLAEQTLNDGSITKTWIKGGLVIGYRGDQNGGKNVPGGEWDIWGEGSVKYLGEAIGGTNFIGPGPDKNPYELGMRPVDEIDAGALNHDYSYWQNKVGGISGAYNSTAVRFADQDLVYVAISIMERYQVGGIDKVTGLPISQRTYNLATAVYMFFAPIVVEKFRREGVTVPFLTPTPPGK